MATDCLFCKMVSGQIKPDKVHEDADILAFRDIHPQAPVHVLVIPKKHIPSLLTLDESDNAVLLELIATIKQITAQVVAEHGGARVLTNLGQYQDSKHLHFHINYGEALR